MGGNGNSAYANRFKKPVSGSWAHGLGQLVSIGPEDVATLPHGKLGVNYKTCLATFVEVKVGWEV